MKRQRQVLLFLLATVGLSSCANVYTITDRIALYPDNAAAQKWGMLNFFTQYQSDQSPGRLSVPLPDGKILSGQLTYVQNTGRTTSDDSFWDNVYFGVGVGGHHHGGFGGITVGPRHSTYQSDKATVSINAFDDKLSLNCQGEFNQRQNNGTVNCHLTNGMQYRGTIQRTTAK